MSMLSAKTALTFLFFAYGTKAKGVRSRHDAFVESNESLLAEDDKSWTRYAMEEINSIAPTASPTTPGLLTTDSPTRRPTEPPTQKPTTAGPTKGPTRPPTRNPTPSPTGAPISQSPTQAPNPFPTTSSPTKRPTPSPTTLPTPPPSPFPTAVVPVPTPNPTPPPTPPPTNSPTPPPTPNPTPGPTPAPTPSPTPGPTPQPTPAPTANPTPPPTPPPTPQPTPSPTAPLQPTVQIKLTPYAIDAAAWQDPGSYQSQALRRTEEQVGSQSMTDAKLVQYYSLYCIYTATNGVPNNITNDDPRFVNIAIPNWLFDNNWNENNVDPCAGSWYGIACSNDQVIGIDLSSNILTGIFPPEVSLLSSENLSGAGALRALVLLKNEFLYSEDNSWIADLGPNLLTLYFQETSLAGPLPKMPKNLFEFDCSFSLINGGLTDENFAGLNNLNYMVVSGLSLGSSIPSVFGSLQNLEFFYAADSLITGDLSYMQGMPSIRQHWVDDNPGLGGPLFPFIADIQTMESMSLTDNALTGSIPTEFGRMTNIEDLWLFGNKLTGTVPTEMGNLRRMKFFQVEGNDLTGVMPDQVCANTQFPSEVLTVLGADCSEVSCSCCDCCSYDTCPNK